MFGNRLVPTTLSVTVEESHFVYSTKPAVCTLDRFMHFVKSKAENVRVMLVPSLKYTGNGTYDEFVGLFNFVVVFFFKRHVR